MIKKILIIIFIISQSTLFAGIGVDPVILEVAADKDTPATGIFKVLNSGKNPVYVRVSPEKWQGIDTDPGAWLKLEPMEFQLAQGETKEVIYKIKPPIASSGELRSMVFFVADEIGENRSNVGIRFGVPIYAIVSGTEVIDAEIKNLEIRYRDSVLSGTILVNNKSNIHIRPNISVDVLDSKDRLVSSYNLPHGQPAQAGQNRPFMLEKYLVLSKGRYKVVVKVDYGMTYGLEGKIARKKISLVVKGDEETK